MGKGDIKTKKGKIFHGSYGVSRPSKSAQRKKKRDSQKEKSKK